MKVIKSIFVVFLIVPVIAWGDSAMPDGDDSNIVWFRSDQLTDLEIVDGDTFKLRFKDNQSETEEFTHAIRLAGIDAPEWEEDDHGDCLAEGARRKLQGVLSDSTLRIGLAPTKDMHLPFHTAGFNRLLGFLQTDSEEMAQVQLVRRGLALIDIRKSDLIGEMEKGFELYKRLLKASFGELKGIVQAQIDAARSKSESNWWWECDPYRDSGIAIALIDFWSDEQIVYIVNRDTQAELTHFLLVDKGGNRLDFSKIAELSNCTSLNEGQLLKIKSKRIQGDDIKPPTLENKDCAGDLEIRWEVKESVWNQSARSDRREAACLFWNWNKALPEKLDCKETDIEANSSSICYVYQYPPDFDIPTPTKEISTNCRNP